MWPWKDSTSRSQLVLIWASSALLFLLNDTCQACTVFLVGKDASVDGSVLVSHSNDGEFETDPRLVKIPHTKAKKRPVFFSPENYPRYVGTARGDIPEYAPGPDQDEFEPIGYLSAQDFDDNLDLTYSYLEETYGALNEKQLGIGESTCSGVFGAVPLGAPNGTALLSIDELTHIAMERTSTARAAIQLMGRLAERYGFYGAGEFEGTAESLGVTDVSEAWIFHILPDPSGQSAIWAAQRIPDDSFAVLANMFVIRQVDPSDHDNFLMSDSVHSVAAEYGWWDASDNELLDFTAVYSDGEYAHKYYSGRRMWGAYRLAAPSLSLPPEYTDLQSDPVYPVYVKPDYKLSVADLFRFHRDTYKNTPYDLGAVGNLAAGPFGSPDRWKAAENDNAIAGNWERPIGLYRTSDTYVVQSLEASLIGGVLWFGPASALGTVFTPFVTGLVDIPASYRSGHHAVLSRESAFWAACFVHNVANLKWNYAVHDICKLQNELEGASMAMVQYWQTHHAQHDDFASVQRAFLENAARIVEKLWSLSDAIVFKYASGFVNEPPDGMSQQVGYPNWWLEEVGYADGPPPPPTKPKCCHPPKEPTTNKEPLSTGRVRSSSSSANDSNKSNEKANTPEDRSSATARTTDEQQILTGKAAMKHYLQTKAAQAVTH